MQVRAEDAPDRERDFDASLKRNGLYPLTATGIEVLQVNFGRVCNLACRHCHVEAGPTRREMIGREVLKTCLEVLARAEIPTVDLTGGAPELNPHFRWFVEECRRLRRRVLVRTNLVVMLEPGQEDLGTFFRTHQVEIIASLPCYTAEDVDAQRGTGVFPRALAALKALNQLAYGQDGSGLTLNLVYNPGGPQLPPSQARLEADYRRELRRRHGVVFSRLLTLTNMPVGRFRRNLDGRGQYHRYVGLLADSFNSRAAAGVMCKTTISVGHDGAIFDCDFNQMLGLTCNHGAPGHLREFDPAVLGRRRIVTGPHCFGCTAGAGSSCGGALT